MREIAVLSGKGGTGKTSLTAAFAVLAADSVVVDCDVDAADLHLVLEPDVQETHEFIGGKLAEIVPDKCVQCGICAELCRFEAIRQEEQTYSIDRIACEGCGVCSEFCPAGAIILREEESGKWFVSDTRAGPLVHARLNVAAENSGKLVTVIKNRARELAESVNAALILVDGPPGIGCPVIASMSGSDEVLVVTEPTVSGIHDLRRVAQLAAHFKLPVSIVVNKCDINPDVSGEIQAFADENNFPVLAMIDYDEAVTRAQLEGKTIVEYDNGATARKVRNLWERIAAGQTCRAGTGASDTGA